MGAGYIFQALSNRVLFSLQGAEQRMGLTKARWAFILHVHALGEYRASSLQFSSNTASYYVAFLSTADLRGVEVSGQTGFQRALPNANQNEADILLASVNQAVIHRCCYRCTHLSSQTLWVKSWLVSQ